MTDYKKMIAEHSCKPNQGCGVMTICMCGVAEDMADEIERLREALYVISTHPVEQSKQWEIGAREMQKLARLSLEEEWGGRFNKMAQALGYFLAIDEDSQSSWKYGREEAAKLARTALGEKE